MYTTCAAHDVSTIPISEVHRRRRAASKPNPAAHAIGTPTPGTAPRTVSEAAREYAATYVTAAAD